MSTHGYNVYYLTEPRVEIESMLISEGGGKVPSVTLIDLHGSVSYWTY